MDNLIRDVDNQQRFAIKIAGFNLLFLFLGIVIAAGFYAVFQMMSMFILAMIWAVLVGTMLFPIKYRMSQGFTKWLEKLDGTDTPFLIGLVKLPYDYLLSISESMYNFVWSMNGLYAVLILIILKLLNYESTLSGIFYIIGAIYSYADSVLGFINNSSWLFPMFLLYASAYGAWLYVQDPESIHKKFARSLSFPIWLYVLAYVSGFSGPFRVIIFIGTSTLLGLISAGIIDPGDEKTDVEPESKEELQDSENKEGSIISENIREDLRRLSESMPSLEEMAHPISTDMHLRIVGGLVVAMWMIKHEFFCILFIFPLILASIRRVCQLFGVFEIIQHYVSNFWQSASPQFHKMFTIVAAGPLRKFLKLLFTSDRFMVNTLRAKADVIATASVMALLAFGSIFAIFFVGFEIHNETVHLVKLGADVMSNNREWFKYAVNYTEDQIREHNIDDYVEEAYQQGRKWLASNVRSLADPKDPYRADELEKQALILVDQLYQLWDEKTTYFNNSSNNSVAITSSNGILEHLSDLTNLSAFQNEITNIVKNNIDTILSILQSLWAVIIVNISVLNTIIFTILHFVFGFGFDMVNLFIEAIVFLTMIFYLLVYSQERWLPLKWFDIGASFINNNRKDVDDSTKANITSAIESAIRGVFVLSAKMSLFYGLYTYFIHSLFNLNIVFVPSLLASLFAAIPIIPAYSVLVFGAIELYFVRQEAVATLVFTIMSIAPIGFADGAFYSEVKNSHPYVTGLAIIGGMYWLGLQGAIFGPIILCSMIALINLYVQFSS